MTLFRKIAIVAVMVVVAVMSGYFYGFYSSLERRLRSTIHAYQTREGINHATETLHPFALCRALGGMSEQCVILMRGMDTPAQNQ